MCLRQILFCLQCLLNVLYLFRFWILFLWTFCCCSLVGWLADFAVAIAVLVSPHFEWRLMLMLMHTESLCDKQQIWLCIISFSLIFHFNTIACTIRVTVGSISNLNFFLPYFSFRVVYEFGISSERQETVEWAKNKINDCVFVCFRSDSVRMYIVRRNYMLDKRFPYSISSEFAKWER